MNYIEYCAYLYASLRIPVSYLEDGRLLYSSFTEATSLRLTALPDAHYHHKNPDLYEPSSNVLYGRVDVESKADAHLILGPAYNIPVSEGTVRDFMRENAIPHTYRETVTAFLQNIPLTVFAPFISHLAFIHLTLNQKAIDVAEHFLEEDFGQTKDIAAGQTLSVYEAKENATLHNTYYQEMLMQQFIREGNAEKLKQYLNERASSLREGTVAAHPLRQAKNTIIEHIAKIVVLAAIPGGMDIEEAYFLNDIYIQKIEQLTSVEDVYMLAYNMMLDFCSRISKSRLPSDLSSELHTCIAYIRDHTNEPIRIADVARQIAKSESYVVKKFKGELGINVGAFILRCRLEEAKSLLSYSDKSLSEISSYLCFSSQSHFQNAFKKQYGITPAAYRRKGTAR